MAFWPKSAGWGRCDGVRWTAEGAKDENIVSKHTETKQNKTYLNEGRSDCQDVTSHNGTSVDPGLSVLSIHKHTCRDTRYHTRYTNTKMPRCFLFFFPCRRCIQSHSAHIQYARSHTQPFSACWCRAACVFFSVFFSVLFWVLSSVLLLYPMSQCHGWPRSGSSMRPCLARTPAFGGW